MDNLILKPIECLKHSQSIPWRNYIKLKTFMMTHEGNCLNISKILFYKIKIKVARFQIYKLSEGYAHFIVL